MQSSGCVLKESECAVQCVCSEGIRGCGPVGVF